MSEKNQVKVPTPNQLTIKVTGNDSRELQAVLEMSAVQALATKSGEEAVRDAIYGVFKQLCDAIKKG